LLNKKVVNLRGRAGELGERHWLS